jgi:hypothetical protein
VGGWIKPQPLIFKRKNMAKKFLTGLNLVVLPTDPVTGSEGELYFNSSASVAKIYQAGAWSVLGAGGGGSTSDSFKTIAVTGQDSVVAESSTDILSLVAGTNVSITTNASTDSITINADSKATSSVYLVRNNTGSTILKGTLVSASGAEPSGRIDVEPFAAVGGINSELTVMGMATANISNGVNGEVISFGTLTGIDTRGDTTSAIAVGDETWAAGDILFAHPTVAGKLTKVRPQHDLAVAFITVRHASTGQIAVRIIPGNNHLEWMHDVSITTPLDDQALIYNSSASVWNNASIVNSLTGTNNEIEVSSNTGDITIGIPTSPVFTTPDIGAAIATSINGTTIPTDSTLLISDDINDTIQGYSSTLNDLAGSTLIGNGFVKLNGVGVWSIDSNEYLTTSSASTIYQEIVENVSDTEIGYLNGVTSDIQTQIDFKLAASSASTTYLTQASASTTYQPIGSYLTSESDTLETVTDRGASSTNAITITNATAASSPTTGALIVTGGVGIGEDLYVDNDVYIGGDINITGAISGSLSFINVTDLVVTDPLIYLADSNPNDMVDIGIFGAYNHSSSVQYHTGLIRDASDSGKWKLASNLLDPTGNVIDYTGATFDTLVVGSLESTNASATRTNLGLAIGTDVQAYDADLAAIAAGTIDGGTP